MHSTMSASPRALLLDYALALFAAAILALFCAATFAEPPAHAAAVPSTTRNTVDAATRFQFVALFASGTSSRDIEAWRSAVLARAHVQGCVRGRACMQRALRLSALGDRRVEALAFDLAAETPAAERTAILAAATSASPHAEIHYHTSPLRAAGG